MLQIVNEALFSFESKEDRNQHGDFNKLSINTSNSILKKSVATGDLDPSIRTFARLISPDKDYRKYNLAYSAQYSNDDHAQILFKCTPEIKHDSTIYVIAIPFNGIIRPIPVSDQYRVLKGMVSVSHQYSVTFNGRKYCKILYMIISPRMSLFQDTTKPPIENIEITFDAYSYNKPKDGVGEGSSTHEATVLKINNDGYTIETTHEIIGLVDMTQYKGVDLFTIYRIPDRVPPAPVNTGTRITTFAKAMDKAIDDIKNPAKTAEESHQSHKSYNKNYYKKDDDMDEVIRQNRSKKKKNKHRG